MSIASQTRSDRSVMAVGFELSAREAIEHTVATAGARLLPDGNIDSMPAISVIDAIDVLPGEPILALAAHTRRLVVRA